MPQIARSDRHATRQGTIVNCAECGTHVPDTLTTIIEGFQVCPECAKWRSARPIILRSDHPYVAEFDPSIMGPLGMGGGFRVKWHDFSTMKQDHEFMNRDEAEAFRHLLIAQCRRVYPEKCGSWTSFEEMNAFWEPNPEPPPDRALAPQDHFYQSRQWRQLRYKALKRDGARCVLCGRTRAHGVTIHVDHIEPRSKRPDLELVLSNLQVMCEDCNRGKSNLDNTDWRYGL